MRRLEKSWKGRSMEDGHAVNGGTGSWREGQERGADILVEVAGRDSVAAAVALARAGKAARMLPTVARTGTEHGDRESLLRNVERLRELAGPFGTEVLEPATLGSPAWWRATIGRVNTVLARRYGAWHICVGCHMYLHAVRAPLAWRAGVSRLVGGERLAHQGKVKINQTRQAVDAYRLVMAKAGIGLELPLLELDDEEEILSLAGDWGEGEGQPGCVLSGNYCELDGGVRYEEDALFAYLEEYLVPVTSSILLALRLEGKADYETIVTDTLESAGERRPRGGPGPG